MSWLWVVGAGWLVLGLLVGLLIGGGIRMADRKQTDQDTPGDSPNVVVIDAGSIAGLSIPSQAPAPAAESLPSDRKYGGT